MSGPWNIPPSWAWKQMGDVSTVVGGGTPDTRTDGFFGGDVAWLTPADLSGYTAKYISRGARHLTQAGLENSGTRMLPTNAVLFTSRAPVGYVAIARNPICTNQGFKSFVLEDGLSPDYVYYYLQHAKPFALELSSGTTFPEISGKNAARIPIPVTATAEQIRISETLDELFSDLDVGVAALERARDRLKRYRASVLKVAVEGALTTDWRVAHPNVEPGSELLKRILAERRQRWQEEQLRKFAEKGKAPPKNWRSKYKEPVVPDTAHLPPLPDGWRWASLGQCFVVRVGATPSRSVAEYWNGDLPWVASGEVQFGPIVATREQITAEGLANSSTQINPRGSVILNMIGEGKTRGKAGVLEIDACNNQNCSAIWVSQTPISPKYIYYWLVYQYEETRQLGSGNNQPAMNKSVVENILFPVPPVAEQEAVVELVDDKLSIIDHLESDLDARLTASNDLRQAILRHAFTGRLAPQDPNGEPASELLKCIADERQARTRKAVATRRVARNKDSGRAGRRGRPRTTTAEAPP